MKKNRIGFLAVAFAVAGLAASAAAPAQEKKGMEMPQPGPEHQKMSYFLGKWHSTATLKPGPWGPGGPVNGDDECTLMQGGFFVVCKSEGSGPMGKMSGIGIMGYDATKKSYTWNGFNSMGENESAQGTVAGKVWTYNGQNMMGGKTLKTRYTITEASPSSYDFKAESSEDGTNWTTLMEGHVAKTGAPPVKR
jgi:Protein of unknown function (DUF1579)